MVVHLHHHRSRTRRRTPRLQSIARAWLFLLNNRPTVILLVLVVFPRILSRLRSIPRLLCLRLQRLSIPQGTITVPPMVCARERLRVRSR